jgi:hypothetical protein
MIILVDSFQHTLDYDTNQFDQLKTEHELEKRVLNNLTQLTEEYSVDNKLSQDKTTFQMIVNYDINMNRINCSKNFIENKVYFLLKK